MGESESKFRPEPQDVWYKSRVPGRQPRLIQSVMQAIVDLKEPSGSTHSRIVEYLQGVINCRNITPRPRGLAFQVKKALKHGLDKGLLKCKSGKFLVGLNAKDFAIFKGFRAYDPIFGEFKKKNNKKHENNKKMRYAKGRKRQNCSNLTSDSSLVNGICYEGMDEADGDNIMQM